MRPALLRLVPAAAALTVLSVLGTGCDAGRLPQEPAHAGSTVAAQGASDGGGSDAGGVTLDRVRAALPAPDTPFDYQLSQPYDPPAGTGVVVRDSTAAPAAGLYSICYVNAFQTQPGESAHWRGLILRRWGRDVRDPGWPDEFVLDVSTPAKRERIAGLLRPVLDRCARAGFQGVELDNLDSYSRSHGAFTLDDDLALAAILARDAHERGLSVAQKNTVEAVDRGPATGFDLAITESCGTYSECAPYEKTYPLVLDVEYGSAGEFAEACRSGDVPASAIRRDRELTAPGASGHVEERCPAGS